MIYLLTAYGNHRSHVFYAQTVSVGVQLQTEVAMPRAAVVLESCILFAAILYHPFFIYYIYYIYKYLYSLYSLCMLQKAANLLLVLLYIQIAYLLKTILLSLSHSSARSVSLLY
jgi:hypothetical protein